MDGRGDRVEDRLASDPDACGTLGSSLLGSLGSSLGWGSERGSLGWPNGQMQGHGLILDRPQQAVSGTYLRPPDSLGNATPVSSSSSSSSSASSASSAIPSRDFTGASPLLITAA